MLANYDASLVAASYVVAVFAAYTALYFGARLVNTSGAARRLWLGFGAFAMGTGVWTMHFVGMQASPMMAEMSYGAGLTFVSWAAAIFASAIALHLIGRETLKLGTLLAASVAMGAGIVVMHYLGMYAMNMSLPPVFNSTWLAVSVVIALAASGAALAICRRVQREEGGKAIALQLIAALVMAAAICGMHYSGMLGMTYPEAAVPEATNTLGGTFFGLPLAVLCVALLAVALFVTGQDITARREAEALKQEQAQWVTAAAFQDATTGLGNRSALEQRVLDAIAKPDGKQSFALIYLDIANYRDLAANQNARSLDDTIRVISERISACLDEGAFLARYSSSSFMIVVNAPTKGGHDVMYKRLQQLDGLNTDDGYPVLWRVGQSLYPQSGHSSRGLIRAAMVSQSMSELGSFDKPAQDPTLVRTAS